MNRIQSPRAIRRPTGRRARRSTRAAAALAAAFAASAAPALEIVPAQGQSPEQTERDKTECMALAREATDAESGGALRISEPVLGGAQPIQEAAQGGADGDEPADADRTPGLFGGLHHGGSGTLMQWRTRREAAVTRTEDELERAYAACLEARGYAVGQ